MSLMSEVFIWVTLIVRPRTAPAAEILFLRQTVGLLSGASRPPNRLTNTARLILVFWSRLCDWKDALMIVKPETLIIVGLFCFMLWHELSPILRVDL
jgi:hypothetical protein